MKVYLIRKFETQYCGIFWNDIWKIVNDYDLIIREIKNDTIDEREVLNIQYQNDPKCLVTVNKVIPNRMSYSCSSGESDVVMIREWPLFTYVVSEMEVVTE